MNLTFCRSGLYNYFQERIEKLYNNPDDCIMFALYDDMLEAFRQRKLSPKDYDRLIMEMKDSGF